MEQKNHTLVEMARTMLDEHRTPKRFWADAISTACYISNRIILCSILYLIPFELHRQEGDSMGHASRFSGLLRMEATRARVSQPGLKTGRGTTAGGAHGTIAEVASRSRHIHLNKS
jgi:hypothetical protein